MQVSQRCIDFIASEEGFRATPYNDLGDSNPASACTVGYGNKLHDGRCTAEELALPPITEAEGRVDLVKKINAFAAVVNEIPGLNQNQFDALVSFEYNTGAALGTLRLIVWNPQLILEWIHDANHQVVPGLVTRRQLELDMYLSEADMTVDEVQAQCDLYYHTNIEWRLVNILQAIDRVQQASVAVGNALIDHVANHPGGGATITMAAALADVQAKLGVIETETADLQAKLAAIGAAASGKPAGS